MKLKLKDNFVLLTVSILLILSLWLLNPTLSPIAVTPGATYQTKAVHSPDGIGKFYQGREIAKVMGHTGASWLERPSREAEEHPSKIINAIDLKPNDVVADIGAGTGYLSFRIASLIPKGKVFAVDIQPEMLDIIKFLKKDKNISNVETILATVNNPNLPLESVDLAIMVDAYHEFEYPLEVMQGIVSALKPGGRVVLVEYRGRKSLCHD